MEESTLNLGERIDKFFLEIDLKKKMINTNYLNNIVIMEKVIIKNIFEDHLVKGGYIINNNTNSYCYTPILEVETLLKHIKSKDVEYFSDSDF